MRTLVMKFGGTSVGEAPAVSQAAAIVVDQAKAWERLVVIVSAMRSVTDALIQGGAHGSLRRRADVSRARHRSAGQAYAGSGRIVGES